MKERQNTAHRIDISLVIAEYKKWEGIANKKLAIDQALHPATLNSFPWEDPGTAKEIAKFVLQEAEEETKWWVDDRKSIFLLERDESYKRSYKVMGEVRKLLKMSNT